jgi:pimeloyl-ACP methyl ester carboxylesterase
MGVGWDEINPSGTRTMILVGGGDISDAGVRVKPLVDQDEDYQRFVRTATASGWRILALRGQDYPEAYYTVIAVLAGNVRDQRKSILVGHSAGAFVVLDYVKDRPQDSWFEKVLLFNCPLVYQDAKLNMARLQSCYQRTEQVTADTTLTMSKRDFFWNWTVAGVSMTEALDTVRRTCKVDVQVIDQPDYGHSPFPPSNVALKMITQFPTSSRIQDLAELEQTWRTNDSDDRAKLSARTVQWSIALTMTFAAIVVVLTLLHDVYLSATPPIVFVPGFIRKLVVEMFVGVIAQLASLISGVLFALRNQITLLLSGLLSCLGSKRILSTRKVGSWLFWIQVIFFLSGCIAFLVFSAEMVRSVVIS